MTNISDGRALRAARLKFLNGRRSEYEIRRREAAERCLREAEDFRRWAAEDGDDLKTLWLESSDASDLKALDPLRGERESLEQQERDLRAWWNDRAVLVRTSEGIPLQTYHVGPECGLVSGRGRHPERFQTLFEGEAKSRGLRPCSVGACAAALRSSNSLSVG
jgi:hypothetical protein